MKSYVAPVHPTYAEFSNVESIYDAARLLQARLPTLIEEGNSLRLEQTNSARFLEELRDAQHLRRKRRSHERSDEPDRAGATAF